MGTLLGGPSSLSSLRIADGTCRLLEVWHPLQALLQSLYERENITIL
jgi:hypothetical protein